MRPFLTITDPLLTAQSLFMDLVFPNDCLSCDTPLTRHKGSLCQPCLTSLQPLDPQHSFDHLSVKDGINDAWVGWAFSDELRNPIHVLKYQDRALLGKELGIMLAKQIKPKHEIDLLIPVPLHPVKERDRGYNQALWIAKGLQSVWKTPIMKKAIQRIKSTETQTALNKVERQGNMEGAFKIKKEFTGQTIGIVDDVLTTGSTISSMAVELKKAGAGKILAITVATPLEKMND